jgi:hypothetical protein
VGPQNETAEAFSFGGFVILRGPRGFEEVASYFVKNSDNLY